jgi:hypothetical protein
MNNIKIHNIQHIYRKLNYNINPSIPNDLYRCHAVSPLNFNVPSKNLGMQRRVDRFIFGIKWLSHS